MTATQREKPGTNVAELAATLGITPTPECYVSGGQIENFKAGWAKHAVGEKAHYFKRDGFAMAVSLCNLSVTVRLLFGRGNFPHCQRCVKLYRNRGMGRAA